MDACEGPSAGSDGIAAPLPRHVQPPLALGPDRRRVTFPGCPSQTIDIPEFDLSPTLTDECGVLKRVCHDRNRCEAGRCAAAESALSPRIGYRPEQNFSVRLHKGCGTCPIHRGGQTDSSICDGIVNSALIRNAKRHADIPPVRLLQRVRHGEGGRRIRASMTTFIRASRYAFGSSGVGS